MPWIAVWKANAWTHTEIYSIDATWWLLMLLFQLRPQDASANHADAPRTIVERMYRDAEGAGRGVGCHCG